MSVVTLTDENGSKKLFRQCVFIVLSRYSSGTPRNCRLALEDEVIDLKKHNQFITALVPEQNIKEL